LAQFELGNDSAAEHSGRLLQLACHLSSASSKDVRTDASSPAPRMFCGGGSCFYFGKWIFAGSGGPPVFFRSPRICKGSGVVRQLHFAPGCLPLPLHTPGSLDGSSFLYNETAFLSCLSGLRCDSLPLAGRGVGPRDPGHTLACSALPLRSDQSSCLLLHGMDCGDGTPGRVGAGSWRFRDRITLQYLLHFAPHLLLCLPGPISAQPLGRFQQATILRNLSCCLGRCLFLSGCACLQKARCAAADDSRRH